MKLIALLAFKDEEWILPAYLSSLEGVVDEIVGIDDGSTDRSRALVEEAGGYVVENEVRCSEGWAEHAIRERLLRLGRERGGTHFLCLDADEALTSTARVTLRPALEALPPGAKLALRWLTLWKSQSSFRHDGSVWTDLYKDFAWADDPSSDYSYAFLGVARTPGANRAEDWTRLPAEAAAVLHYQFVPWRRTEVKQAWYRCSEFLKAPDRAFEINRTYAHSLDDPGVRTLEVSRAWTESIEVPVGIEDLEPAWHLDAILSWFDQRGAGFFEPLQIWQVPELRARFVEEVGRAPEPVLALRLPERLRRASAARLRRLAPTRCR